MKDRKKALIKFKLPALVVILLVVLCLSSSAWGAKLTNAKKKNSPGMYPDETRVAINFQDADIRTVAKFISDITGRNFIFDKKVRDKVTVFSPTEVTPQEAYLLFETVLKIHGYTTVPTNGVIKIMPSQEAKTTDVETRPKVPAISERGEDRVVTQLVRLKYADPTQMRTLLQPLIAKTGLLIAYDDGNTLIITDYASNIDRLLKIIDSVDVPDEGTQMEIIILQNASAKDLARELQDILTVTPQQRAGKPRQVGGRGGFTVVPDERTNSLIILARAQEIENIRKLVARLDAPSQRGSDRIHVYFLKNAVAEDMATTLSELVAKAGPQQAQKTTGAARVVLQEEVFVTADKATNSLVIRAERQDYLVLKNIIEQLDIQRAQVLVEGVVMQMSVQKVNALGAEWRVLDPDTDGTIPFGGTGFSSDGLINQLSANPFGGAGGLILGAAEGTLTWGNTTFLNIGMLVQALEQDTDVNILATPYLLTMDNEEARIMVGEERPFLKSSLTTATTSSTASVTNTYEFKDLGLTLELTPHITQGDFVKLKIYQELKSYVGESETGAITSTKRETETSVLVQDKEVVVIGGMISEEQRENKDAVPCVGSIPGLGWLFKQRGQQADRLNLIILLKPSIIRTAEQLKEATIRKQRATEAMGMAEEKHETGYPQRGIDMLED